MQSNLSVRVNRSDSVLNTSTIGANPLSEAVVRVAACVGMYLSSGGASLVDSRFILCTAQYVLKGIGDMRGSVVLTLAIGSDGVLLRLNHFPILRSGRRVIGMGSNAASAFSFGNPSHRFVFGC